MAWTSTPKKHEFMAICGYIIRPSIAIETHGSPYQPLTRVTEIQICGKVTDMGAVDSLLRRGDSVGEDRVVIDTVSYKPGKVAPEERLRVKLKKWNRWLDEYHQMVYEQIAEKNALKAGDLDE